MAALKIAALSLGALAFAQADASPMEVTSTNATEGKIDGGLLPLLPMDGFKADETMKNVLQTTDAPCSPASADTTWKKALLLQLDPQVQNNNYTKNLDKVIEEQLPLLKSSNGTVDKNSAVLGHIIDSKAFKVGCGVTSGCEPAPTIGTRTADTHQWLFCVFKNVSEQEVAEPTKIEPSFLAAMEARLAANYTLANMTEKDLSTPLTSGAVKTAVGVLALGVVTLPLLF